MLEDVCSYVINELGSEQLSTIRRQFGLRVHYIRENVYGDNC